MLDVLVAQLAPEHPANNLRAAVLFVVLCEGQSKEMFLNVKIDGLLLDNHGRNRVFLVRTYTVGAQIPMVRNSDGLWRSVLEWCSVFEWSAILVSMVSHFGSVLEWSGPFEYRTMASLGRFIFIVLSVIYNDLA